MIRLLCLVSAMNAGGAETFLMKIYRRLDRSKYQMDFCVNVKAEGLYDAEIRSMGGRIYRIPSKSENIKEFTRQLYNTVHNNGYKNVLRITSNAMGFYDLHIAKKAGAINCIARSSNSSDGGGIKSKAAHLAGKALYKRDADVKIAPSDLAAVYTFGRKDYETGKVKIMHNGIDFDEYRFSEDARKSIRDEFGISDGCFLIGHIGRFTEQKNHAFLVKLFSEIHKICPDTKLLLVGEGELGETVLEKCREMNIEENVIFTGVRKDIPALLSAMDLFVFPSFYEGMPNVIIEAQASGLKCLVSDSITREVKITNLVEMLSINDNKTWIDTVVSCIKNRDPAGLFRTESTLPGEYDINNVCRDFASLLV